MCVWWRMGGFIYDQVSQRGRDGRRGGRRRRRRRRGREEEVIRKRRRRREDKGNYGEEEQRGLLTARFLTTIERGLLSMGQSSVLPE